MSNQHKVKTIDSFNEAPFTRPFYTAFTHPIPVRLFVRKNILYAETTQPTDYVAMTDYALRTRVNGTLTVKPNRCD